MRHHHDTPWCIMMHHDVSPTDRPTDRPTVRPTDRPTSRPSRPTSRPTDQPTDRPTGRGWVTPKKDTWCPDIPLYQGRRTRLHNDRVIFTPKGAANVVDFSEAVASDQLRICIPNARCGMLRTSIDLLRSQVSLPVIAMSAFYTAAASPDSLEARRACVVCELSGPVLRPYFEATGSFPASGIKLNSTLKLLSLMPEA